MNHLTTTKLIAYLAFIFIAGGTTGAVLMLKNAQVQERQTPSMEKTCNRLQDRLASKLSLTSDQMKKLQPVFEQTSHELRIVHARAIADTDAIIRKAHQRIAVELTPEQKVKLEQCDAQRHEWLRRRIKEQGGNSETRVPSSE